MSFQRRLESRREVDEKIFRIYTCIKKKWDSFYTGVTNDLKRRVYEHKNGLIEGFTKNHKVHNLVYFEEFNNINDALQREKHIKTWKRAWKIKRIVELNPNWKDLYVELF